LFKETRKGKRKATISRSITKYDGKLKNTRHDNIHFYDEEIQAHVVAMKQMFKVDKWLKMGD
jgi:hypothetical protein